MKLMGFQVGLVPMQERDSIPGLIGRSPGKNRQWQRNTVFLPEKLLGERSLLGYSPW